MNLFVQTSLVKKIRIALCYFISFLPSFFFLIYRSNNRVITYYKINGNKKFHQNSLITCYNCSVWTYRKEKRQKEAALVYWYYNFFFCFMIFYPSKLKQFKRSGMHCACLLLRIFHEPFVDLPDNKSRLYSTCSDGKVHLIIYLNSEHSTAERKRNSKLSLDGTSDKALFSFLFLFYLYNMAQILCFIYYFYN